MIILGLAAHLQILHAEQNLSGLGAHYDKYAATN